MGEVSIELGEVAAVARVVSELQLSHVVEEIWAEDSWEQWRHGRLVWLSEMAVASDCR